MTTRPFIPVAAPVFNGNERTYVLDCVDSTWISSGGKYVGLFEKAFAKFCEAKYAASCCNGTAALHLALLALGVGPGDEVIVPTLSFIATANVVTYCGAKPVFVDSEAATWNIDPQLIEARITPATKGIIVVHLYGQPVDLDPILALARRRGLFVVEDAAEAHGAEYKGRRVGSWGDIAAFSFFGNKIITTGEGGAVVTNRDDLAQRVAALKDQGMSHDRRYWFNTVGYNYRMTNIQAAIGLAQLEKADWHMQRRLEVAAWYQEQLRGLKGVSWQIETASVKHARWMFSIQIDETVTASRDQVMERMLAAGIETRPVFYPMNILPPYQPTDPALTFPVAEKIGRQGISLPTWAGLTEDDISHICACLRSCLNP